MLMTQWKDLTGIAEFTYEFPEDLTEVLRGTCTSRGKVVSFLDSYEGNKSK